MSKPTKQELTMALDQAKYLRESGQDTHCLGKSLMNCNYQMAYLIDVLDAAEMYLNSGMSQTEHTKLLKAIEKAREVGDFVVHYREPNIPL